MIENSQLTYPSLENALHRLCPGVRWSVEYGSTDDEYEIIWPTDVVDPPSDEAIAAEIAALAAAWEDREYITQRKQAYPPLADFADAFYWHQQGDDTKMAAYLQRVETVKQRFPKPETDAVVEITPTPEYVHRDQPPQEGEEPIV